MACTAVELYLDSLGLHNKHDNGTHTCGHTTGNDNFQIKSTYLAPQKLIYGWYNNKTDICINP